MILQCFRRTVVKVDEAVQELMLFVVTIMMVVPEVPVVVVTLERFIFTIIKEKIHLQIILKCVVVAEVFKLTFRVENTLDVARIKIMQRPKVQAGQHDKMLLLWMKAKK